jgi:hypothetical protein
MIGTRIHFKPHSPDDYTGPQLVTILLDENGSEREVGQLWYPAQGQMVGATKTRASSYADLLNFAAEALNLELARLSGEFPPSRE